MKSNKQINFRQLTTARKYDSTPTDATHGDTVGAFFHKMAKDHAVCSAENDIHSETKHSVLDDAFCRICPNPQKNER